MVAADPVVATATSGLQVENLSDEEVEAVCLQIRENDTYLAQFVSWAGAQYAIDESYVNECLSPDSGDIRQDLADFLQFAKEVALPYKL